MPLKSLHRFWLTLECLRGQAAVHEEWRLCLGNEWPLVARYLRPTGRLGGYFPRSDPLRRRAYRAPCSVVPDGEQRFLAVPPEGGESLEVNAEQLTLLELDRARFALGLATALAGRTSDTRFEGLSTVFRIGTLTPVGGFRFPLFLVCARAPAQFRQSVSSIASLQTSPFLLLTPTDQHCDPESEAVLAANRGQLLPLVSSVALNDAGRWELTAAGRAGLRQFLEEHTPRATAVPECQYFATPPGTRWSSLKMRFLDGETVSIVIDNQAATVNYTQFGMVNRRNGRPTRQWELLRIFAKRYGQLDWESRDAHRRHQKQKEILSKRLRTFFRIDQDPFLPAGNGWQTRFSLSPDV